MNAKNNFKSFLILTLFTLCVITYGAEKSSTPLFPDWLQELSQEASDKEIQQLFFDFVITDPTKAFLYNHQVNSAFRKRITPATNLKELNALADKYEKKCPLFLLDECFGELCPFSRTRNSFCKQEFELQVVEKMCTLLNAKQKKPFQYVSFGSGELLLDCFLLAKVLHAQTVQKKQTQALVIHAIDNRFKYYVGYREVYMNNDREMSSTKNTEFLGEVVFRGSINTPEEKNNWLNTTYLWDERGFRQFLSFLETHFKGIKLSMFIHESADSYLRYIKEENIPAADIIVAADIQEADTQHTVENAVDGYKKLYTASKKMNPACGAILLGKEGFYPDEKIQIFFDGDTPLSRRFVFKK